MSNDLVAARYLKNYLKTKTQVETVAPEPKQTEAETFYDNLADVILANKDGKFYAGKMPSGRISWVVSPRMAKKVSADKTHLYEHQFGEHVFAMWPVS